MLLDFDIVIHAQSWGSIIEDTLYDNGLVAIRDCLCLGYEDERISLPIYALTLNP